MTHTPATLIAFRDRVAEAFAAKRIRSPVHLPSDTQAEPLCEIFKDFQPGLDYCFSGWRSMWHALLAGIPEDDLFQMILDGRSMYLIDRARRFFASSIVGGILPIALGVAWSTRKRWHDAGQFGFGVERAPRVWVFAGDMTERTGLFREFMQYAQGQRLPVHVVIEDNGLSTNTPTEKVWGTSKSAVWVTRYQYERTHPHVGLTTRVVF